MRNYNLTNILLKRISMKKNYKVFRMVLMLTLVLCTSMAYAQDRTISGKITDGSDGSGLPGVNILAKGTAAGTVTDVEGNYSLSVPESAETLVISSVGYLSEEIDIAGKSVIDLALFADVKTLDELVVVGYGTQKKATVTTAISSVSSEDLTKTAVSTLEQALQGRAPGVTVTNNSGAPGAKPSIRIRGLGNLRDNEPLYVIDGMVSGIGNLNPQDIESIEILKDASAAAIYGSRASNGVVLVTTKQGKAGKTKITFDTYVGTQSAWKKLDLLNTKEYVAVNTELQEAAGLPVPARFSQNLADSTDWQDEIFRTGTIQEHNIAVSGGAADKSAYRVSFGYHKNEGILLGSSLERFNLGLNTSFNIGKFTFGQTMNLSRRIVDNETYDGARSALEHAIKSAPYIAVYNPDNLGGFDGPGFEDEQDARNAVAQATLLGSKSKGTSILGTAFANLEIIDGLNARFLFGLDYGIGNTYRYTPIYQAGPRDGTTEASVGENNNTYYSPLTNFQLSYDKEIGDHNISITGIVEQQQQFFKNYAINVSKSSNDIPEVFGAGVIAEKTSSGGSKATTAIISYIGRVRYNYQGKYMVSASMRRDGASQFGPDNKWGNFPAFSVGWNIGDESFLADNGTISFLKLRAGWGKTGNNNIGAYETGATVASDFNYTFNDGSLPGLAIQKISNPALKWETTTTTNVGLDVGLLNDRLSLSLDYFDKTTNDLLVQGNIPPSIGFDFPPTINDGKIKNSGFEIAATYRQAEGDFQYSIGANAAFINNEVLELKTPVLSGAFQGENVTRTAEGYSIGYFYGYQTDGLFESYDEIKSHADQGNSPFAEDGTLLPADQLNTKTAPGDIRFKDTDGDGVITPDDRTEIGSSIPDFTYGVTFDASYKNFDFSLFLQGVSGNEIYNGNIYHTQGFIRVFNFGKEALDRWTPSHTNTSIPRAIAGDPNNNLRASDRFIENGAFMRLRNLSVGYTLSDDMLGFGNGFISKVRVYVAAQNLITITKYNGFDPEIGTSFGEANQSTIGNGIDKGQFPQARVFRAGLQVTF